VGRHHAGLSARLRLSTFLYGLALIVHALTCGFVALGGVAGSPTPYLDALYWTVMTVTTVGYGDITPQTPVQKMYAVGVMLSGAGVYAFLIGNIASLLSSLDPLRASHVAQQERMAAFMHYRALPRPLQKRVQAYFDYLWEQHLVTDEDATLAELPPGLREEVALHLRRDLVLNVPLFRDAGDAFVHDVALQMRSFVCLPGDTLVRAGERGHEMFFLARGEVEVISPDGAVLRTLRGGDFFGEIALVTSTVRTATVRATTPSDLYVLSRVLFERIAADYPEVAATVRAEADRRRGDDEVR
jgi:voltage-gated potassium channel